VFTAHYISKDNFFSSADASFVYAVFGNKFFEGFKARPMRKADSLTAICEPIV
jgi:hypothetical protein